MEITKNYVPIVACKIIFELNILSNFNTKNTPTYQCVKPMETDFIRETNPFTMEMELYAFVGYVCQTEKVLFGQTIPCKSKSYECNVTL